MIRRRGMPRKIFHTGNSAVVRLPADVLQRVGLKAGDSVNVVADLELRQIIISHVEGSPPGVRQGFLERVDRFIEQYQPALETLAKE
jgi:putative addiction module antidote